MSRYAFLRSPLWASGIVIALVAVVTFVGLGLWQLRRLDERRTINATIVSRSSAEAIPLALAIAGHGTEAEDLVYRRVAATGEYATGDEVLLVGRTLNGLSGHDVITPLHTEGGTVAVNRGWVPIDSVGPTLAGAEPPGGTVEVIGVLHAGQSRGPLGTPESDGTYRRVGRIDLDALGPQWGGDLYPVYLLLESQQPAGGELPVPRPASELGEGPHLSYAIQWFIFAAIVVVGFPALVYQTARRG